MDPTDQPAGDATLAVGDDPTDTRAVSATSMEAGHRIDRYVILECIGAGGMGVVFAAYDPQLDRRVAIKLLMSTPYASATGGDRAQQRLVREARALAKLNHPNVVAVHDAGAHGRDVFVAMEFVDGETLKDWVGQPRSRAEVLDVFGAAARGLAAAHDAGIVHRDFKPANVMIGKDGRVRVMDFGIARTPGAGESHRPSAPEEAAIDPVLTREGAILGTPRYMAPEQHCGDEVDARSDQFAFAVALYEALYGARPFHGTTVGEIALSVTRGEILPAPAGAGVPSWLRAVVLRGLALDPSARFEDMHSMIAALRNDPGVRRRRVGLAAIGVGILGATAGGTYALSAGTPDVCAGVASAMDATWNDDVRDRIAAAFAASSGTAANETWDRVAGYVDGYALAWAAQREDACQATTVRHEQSARMLDLRNACLDERRDALAALLEVFGQVDDALVMRATTAAYKLPDIQRCSDTATLAAAVPPPEDPATAARVDELRGQLARAAALEHAGRYELATASARAVVEGARETGWPPIIAEALYRAGTLSDRTGAYEDSRRDLREAYFTALSSRHLSTAVDAATKLIHVEADELGDTTAGLLWVEHAQAALGRDEPDNRQSAWVHNNEGNVRLEAGEAVEALSAYERALPALVAAVGDDHPDLAVVVDNIARTNASLGRLDEAAAGHRRALEIRERMLGSGHPHVAGTLGLLAGVLVKQGHPAQAIPHLRRALKLREETLGRTHRQTAEAQFELATTLRLAGTAGDEAAALARTARETLGGDDARSQLRERVDAFLAESAEPEPGIRRGVFVESSELPLPQSD